jgi:molybdenum cofactor cytidylyltransferase
MFACIVLAAGESRRFGSPKALASIDGKALVAVMAERLLRTALDRLIVVLGAEAQKIAPSIPADPRIHVAQNPDYARGQTSSLKKGLEKLPSETSAFLFMPVDLPLLKTETVDLLLRTFAQKTPKILIPTIDGKNGHPPVFRQDLIKEFIGLSDDEPLYTVQRRHAEEILKMPVCDQGVIQSFNTPEELTAILSRAKRPGSSPA